MFYKNRGHLHWQVNCKDIWIGNEGFFCLFFSCKQRKCETLWHSLFSARLTLIAFSCAALKNTASVLMLWRQAGQGPEVDHTARSVDQKRGSPSNAWAETRRNVSESSGSWRSLVHPAQRQLIPQRRLTGAVWTNEETFSRHHLHCGLYLS